LFDRRLPASRRNLAAEAAAGGPTTYWLLVKSGNYWKILVSRCTVSSVSDELEALEQVMSQLRAEVRRAKIVGDHGRARELRSELRDADRRWDEVLARLSGEPQPDAGPGAPAPVQDAAAPPAPQPGVLLPAREQVHQALTLLGAPAAPRLIVAVHDAFFAGRLIGSRLTSLRRDEERSFRVAPYARPYYLCAALTADLLSSARGLLAVSTWPMDRRIIGPLSPRVDYLTAAIAVAERLQRISQPDVVARRLLWRFAANIPHAAVSIRTMTTGDVASAARAELAVHQSADAAHRSAGAVRARAQLDDAEQLFGSGLGLSHQAESGA
jgi:hypothetical protein